MIRTFKLRYVNEIVGVFVLVGLGLAVAGVVAMIGGREWFQPSRHVIIDLPPEGSLGLKPGCSVVILGLVVGQVDAITYEKGKMQADINIRGNPIELVREFSYATIDKPLLGDPFVTIERNDPDWEHEPPLPLGKHIPGFASIGPTEKLQQLLGEVQKQSVPALQEARAAIVEYTKLAAHLNNVIASIEKGEGLAGKLVSDPKLAEQVSTMLPKINASLDETTAMLKELRKTSGTLAELTATAQEDVRKLPAIMDATKNTLVELQGTMQDIRKTTAKLPEVVEGAGQAVQSLPGLVLQMQETLRQVQILVEGFQKSWLVRSHIEKSEPTGRIRADEIGR